MTSGRVTGRFPPFALLWALATLIHQLSFTFWLQTWEGWLLTFATCLVVLEPRCLVRFSALVLFSLLNLWHKLPFVPNHMLFEGLLNFTILLALGGMVSRGTPGLPPWNRILREFVVRFRFFFLACGVKAAFLALTEAPRNPITGGATSLLMLLGLGQALAGRPARPEGGEALVAEVAPILRIQAVVVYWWAVVQKLNHDYFNPEVSCGAALHRDMAEFLPFLPTGDWALRVAIYGSLALEAVIPLFLLIPKTRLLGMVLGVFFHLWLSIHPAGGIYSFSALLFALYFLFLPASAIPVWQGLLRDQGSWLRGWCRLAAGARLPWMVIGLFLAGVLSQALCYTVLGRTRETFEVANRIGFWLWGLFGLWLGGTHLMAIWRVREEPMAWPNRPVVSAAWVVVALVIGNGLCPWVGLKTQTCFSMYSNLRSEAFGNHLFLERIDLFGYQTDLVELKESTPDLLDPTGSPTRLQHFANTGRIFPYFELRRLVSESAGDLRISYRRHGEDLQFVRRGDRVTGDLRLQEPIPLPMRKLLWFRRHETFHGPMHCTH